MRNGRLAGYATELPGSWRVWLNRKKRRSERYTCLHNSFNPCYFVIVLKAHDCGVRKFNVSVEEEKMVSQHDEQPTWDQHQIKVLFLESHNFPFFLSFSAD